MIARFQALLPFVIHRPEADDSAPIESERDGYRYRVWAPVQALVTPEDIGGVSEVPVQAAMDGVRPSPEPKAATGIEIDGAAAIPTNLIVVEFLREDFDRTVAGAPDPPFELAFAIVNDVLARIRTITRASQIHPLIRSRTPARIDYLDDDGSPMPAVPGEKRSLVQAAFGMKYSALTRALWDECAGLPDGYSPPSWDTLLLDAFDLLPSIPSAIVLAFAALESFIDWSLDEFAQGGAVDVAFYRWIADRDDFAKRPSTTEQFDVLLRELGGKSLKEDNDLWRSFTALRKVRNAIVHRGQPELDGNIIDENKAAELVVAASRIIDWIEQLLPESKRRPRTTVVLNTTFMRQVVGPAGGNVGDAGPNPEAPETV